MPSIGKQLAALSQPLQIGQITMRAPIENTMDLTLPTSSPTDPQISFTLTADMFPKLSGLTASYTCLLYIGGQMTTGAVAYVNTAKNGSYYGVASASISADDYFTFLEHRIQFVVPGDVISAKVYSGVADSRLLYYGFVIIPIRIIPLNMANKVCRDVSITTNYPYTFTGGPNPKIASDWGYVYVYTLDTQIASPSNIGTFNYSNLIPGSTYGLVRVMYGDSNTSSFFLTDTTYMPYYRRIAIPTTITYRM